MVWLSFNAAHMIQVFFIEDQELYSSNCMRTGRCLKSGIRNGYNSAAQLVLLKYGLGC